MGILTLEIGIAAIVGAIAGAVGSLIAPWANWGIEKRKRKFMWRKKLIEDCKDALNVSYDNHKSFRETPLYANLRKLLSKSLREAMEDDSITIQVVGRGREYPLKKRLLDEINVLEKKWGLI